MRLGVILLIAFACACYADEDRGFLQSPPVFIDNMYNFPLAGMGTATPKPGDTIPDFDSLVYEANKANRNGANVQPNLNAEFTVTRLGALHGLSEDWGAALSIPIQRTAISGEIGGQPATATNTGLGNIAVLGKRVVWRGRGSEKAVATFGVELPTGKDDSNFDQSNSVTNGYYSGYPQRYPLSWQPSSGTWSGYLALAYSKTQERLSYEALVAGKFYTRGDEDVKIGNIYVGALTGTYGLARFAAISASAVLQVQGDDSYPNAPSPGVDQPSLAGTTLHGTTLYIAPSFRVNVAKMVTVGFGWRIPVIEPDDGLVPEVRSFLIIYPSL
ncbi:MAG: hypothetical protein ABFD83_05230 [Armatimonadota bacterium]